MPESKSIAPKSLADPGETPEDVATLYSWANLHGAKYRDFSASRAEAREEARLRVEEAKAAEQRRLQEEAERKAQEEAQLAARLAAEAAEAARQAEAERLAEIARQAEAERQAVLAAQEAQRLAALQRSWEPPSPDAFLSGYPPSLEELEASLPIVPQAPVQQYAAAPAYSEDRIAATPENGSNIHRRTPVSAPRQSSHQPLALQEPPSYFAPPSVPATQQPYPAPPAAQSFPAPAAPLYPSYASPTPYSEFADPRFPDSRYGESPFSSAPFASAPSEPFAPSPWQPDFRDARDQRDSIPRPAWLAAEIPPPPPQPQQNRAPSPYAQPYPAPNAAPIPSQSLPGQPLAYAPSYPAPPSYASQPTTPQPVQNNKPEPPYYQPPPSNPTPVDDTLSGSRDRIAHRWYALKSVFDPQAAPVEQMPSQPPARVPVLAVFSLAGGVGKTSLVASLGRALSSRGERVLLVDTAAYGLLPFFFGARDQRPGMLRTFNPPGSSAEAPIQLVTLDPEGQAPEFHPPAINQDPNQAPGQDPSLSSIPGGNQDWLAQEVSRYARGSNRVLIDLPTASGSTARRVLRMSPVILVPVAPDMNSMVSVGAIESFFRNNLAASGQGKQTMPYYLLNQFDYSLPLHLDVREILREQIGDRLLPFALRRSPAVSEALAEGMTVMDYAPNAVVAEDYASLADWVRSLSAPATQSYRGVRWSER